LDGQAINLTKSTPKATPIVFPCAPCPIRALEQKILTTEKSGKELFCAVHKTMLPVIARQTFTFGTVLLLVCWSGEVIPCNHPRTAAILPMAKQFNSLPSSLSGVAT
jgi:hypothetical protein